MKLFAQLCFVCLVVSGAANAETLYFAFEGEFVSGNFSGEYPECFLQVPTRFKGCYSVQSDAPDLFSDTNSGGYEWDTFWVEFNNCHFEAGSMYDHKMLTYHDGIYSGDIRDLHEVQVYGIPNYVYIDKWDANLGLLAIGPSDLLTSDDLPTSAPDIALTDQAHFTFWGWRDGPYFLEGGDLFGWVDAYYAATSDCEELIEVTTLSCSGFEPPMANFPVIVKKNRALPLKAAIFGDSGTALTDMDLVARPVVQITFQSAEGGDPVDVTDEALSAGQGSEGNQFEFTDEGKWQFNLKTQNYTAEGAYRIEMVSGDASEYVIDPNCVTAFEVK